MITTSIAVNVVAHFVEDQIHKTVTRWRRADSNTTSGIFVLPLTTEYERQHVTIEVMVVEKPVQAIMETNPGDVPQALSDALKTTTTTVDTLAKAFNENPNFGPADSQYTIHVGSADHESTNFGAESILTVTLTAV